MRSTAHVQLLLSTEELTIPETVGAHRPQGDLRGVRTALAAHGLVDAPTRAAAVVVVTRDAPPPGGTAVDGFPVRTADSLLGALALAHRTLADGAEDLVLVVSLPGAPGTVRVTRVTRRGAPRDREPDGTPADDTSRLLLWSGRTPADAAGSRARMRAVARALTDDVFRALPAVVPCGPAAGPVRGAALCPRADPAAALDAAEQVTAGRPRPVALLFPGQGSQHAAMAAGLYARDQVFTEAVDTVLGLMGAEGAAVRADWLSPHGPVVPVDDVRRAQPLLFAVDYALGSMVMSWGVRPTALLGHSAGELVAAVFAGVVSLGDAVAMMRSRVRHALSVPAGGMLAVAASAERLRPYLVGEVAVAAVNARLQTMLAGPAAPLSAVGKRLRDDGYTVVAVPATSPFHSPAMAPASAAVERAYAGMRFRPPGLALYSGYTGGLMGEREALSPRFWARQITDTVYFGPALDQLLAAEDMLLVEAGPRQTLTSFARRHPAVRSGASAVAPLLPARPSDPAADRRTVLGAVSRLWTEGHDLDTAALETLWSGGPGTQARGPLPAAGRRR
ncbi:acyltransferase domain-containing protein [Streptomyces sp. ACT015]|uniref:acyltransferase domain-containing protein n=1 Tax=Streptomyces sp. ACT015 TaxID=3134807 RepID=UPI003D16E438